MILPHEPEINDVEEGKGELQGLCVVAPPTQIKHRFSMGALEFVLIVS